MSHPETEEQDLDQSSLASRVPAAGSEGQIQINVTPRSLARRTVMLVAGVVSVTLLAVAAAVILFWPKVEQLATPPSDFPSSVKLPLIEGAIVPSGTVDGNLSFVSIIVEDHEAQKKALSLLAEAGFLTLGESGSGPNGAVTSLSRDDLSVRVEFGLDDDGQYTVTYTSAPKVITDDDNEAGEADASPSP